MTQPQDIETLLEFPCDFPIKIMGKSQPEFRQQVLEIIQIHVPDFDEKQHLSSKDSRHGRFESLTVRIRAESKAQLDSIYHALTDCELVLWAL